MKGVAFLKDLLKVGFSNIIMIVFGLGSTIVSARYLGPEKNGVISALLVYPTLFMSFGSLGIRQSTAFFLGKKIYNEDQIKKTITQIWFLTSIVSLLSCYFLMTFFSKSGYNQAWVLLALFPLIFTLFNKYNSGIFLGKNDIATFNKINWIPSVLIFAAVCFFIVFLEMGITGYLIALYFGPFILFLIFLIKKDFIKSFSLRVDWSILKSMLKLGLIYSLALLVINLNYKVDVILLDKLSTPYELGVYSKGVALAQYIWQIPMILSTLVFARSATSKDGYEFSLKVAQLLRLSLLFIILIAFVLIISADFLIHFLFGNDFKESAIILKILILGVVVLTLFKVMNMDLAGKGNPFVSIKAMLPALILNIILNIIYIPKYGAIAASWSSTISYTIAGMLFIYFYSKETNIPIKQIFLYTKDDFRLVENILKKVI